MVSDFARRLLNWKPTITVPTDIELQTFRTSDFKLRSKKIKKHLLGTAKKRSKLKLNANKIEDKRCRIMGVVNQAGVFLPWAISQTQNDALPTICFFYARVTLSYSLWDTSNARLSKIILM